MVTITLIHDSIVSLQRSWEVLPVLSLWIKFVRVAVKVIQIQVMVPESKTHGISVNKLESLILFNYYISIGNQCF